MNGSVVTTDPTTPGMATDARATARLAPVLSMTAEAIPSTSEIALVTPARTRSRKNVNPNSFTANGNAAIPCGMTKNESESVPPTGFSENAKSMAKMAIPAMYSNPQLRRLTMNELLTWSESFGR